MFCKNRITLIGFLGKHADTRFTPNGTAAVICPGGGYIRLVTEPEGHGIAAWLNRHGVTGAHPHLRHPAARRGFAETQARALDVGSVQLL